MTILAGIGFFKKSRIKNFINQEYGSKHIYMIHVGIGWGYGRLPGNVEKKIQFFDPILRWLIIDGYGFHQAYFKTKKYVYKIEEPKEFEKYFSKHVFYQGVGRCLWFIEGADPYKIYDRINTFPEIYKADLWSGVGLACTYAGGGEEKDIKLIKTFSGSFLPHLMQGSAFAAKARERAEIMVPDTEIACKIICNKSVKEAAVICDECLSKIPVDILSEEKYEMWRSLIRSSICKSFQHEGVSEEIIN
jgi:enediyne biosynthesis protein E3